MFGLMRLELLAHSLLALWILGSWQGRNFMEKGLDGGKLVIPGQPGSKEADRKEPRTIERPQEHTFNNLTIDNQSPTPNIATASQ